MSGMLKKSFIKKDAEPRHNNTVFAADMFSHEDVGSDIGSGWGFLKKGMKIESHKHPVKEIYIIIQGKGFMKVGSNSLTVQKGDAIYIPSNDMHTAWNNENEDLEFIYFVFENRPLPFIMNMFEGLIDIMKNRINRYR